MSAIKPLQDRVVVEVKEAEEKTASGILLPGSASEKPDVGTVIAVGDGKVLDNGIKIDMSVKVGDKVLFGKYGGSKVTVEGNEYLVISESDILGVLV